MRRILAACSVALLASALAAISASAAVRGNYLEVRSADVYTGPCFANSETNLEGKQAILAWMIREGSWQGVKLDGLSVVAVVRANATLGDSFHNPYPAKAVLIVDAKADPAQRQALRSFAASAGGQLLAHVVRVETAPIEVEFTGEHGAVALTAGRLARVRTRSLCAADHLCGNEEVYYPPLTRVSHAMPAYTLEDAFSGQGLGVVWDQVDKRSAFVGSFTL
jgi:hypothetical protein